jgi:hypothetical protein
VTVTLLAALLTQAVSVALLRHRLGRHWLRHPVTLVVLAGVVYQGVSPALLAIPSIGDWDNFRSRIQPGYADDAALLTSVGMLAFTVAYLATRPERVISTADPAGIRAAARMLGWRWLAAACVPLAVLTYEGRGYNGAATVGAASSVGTDLAASFFVLAVALAASGFLLRHGTRWFLPVLIVQSAVLAATGQRSPVITDAITLILVLTLAGVRPRPRQLCAAAAIGAAAVLAITGVRVQQGRSLFYADSGLSARLSALWDGLTSSAGPSAAGTSSPGILAQTAVRTDGTSFAAAILQSLHTGQPRLSAAYVPESLLLAVPSTVWSSKLARGNALEPADLEIGNFGLQPGTLLTDNFLPTMPGLYVGFLSPPWLIAFLALLGLLCGRAERRLFRCITPARFVLFAGAVTTAFVYEAGLPMMLVQLRAAAAIAVVVKGAEFVRVRRTEGARVRPVTVIRH